MSDATASHAPDASPAITGDSADAETVLVTFANDADAAGVQFTDAPPSEWAFATHEAALDGDAIDALREPDGNRLLPLVAVATFIAAEAELYADAEDALVAMTSTPFAFDMASGATGAGEDVGMVMWSGDNGESASTVETFVVHARGEPGLALHDIVPHGISLDWTDTILG